MCIVVRYLIGASQIQSTRNRCIELLEDSIARYGAPEIHNSDQGVQYTSTQYIDVLKEHNIQISMDGKGRALDNIYIERFWKSLKYEKIYISIGLYIKL
ncbi:DDE-type integrase/transposase/recombinase [Arenibacter certesii]|uniref:DDE-type integrase/transposase/recombinase n=1 Tax=Arenibacter certesii TaxID=228955 RepID=UPI00047DF745